MAKTSPSTWRCRICTVKKCTGSTIVIRQYFVVKRALSVLRLTSLTIHQVGPEREEFAIFQEGRNRWKTKFALDTGGFPSNGGQENDINGDSEDLGQTRLSRILIAGGRQLLEKLNTARKNFPMKVFLLLLGFYTANALATILGQTGDWDVLVAGIVVAAIEGIGMLMYKRTKVSSRRLQSFVVLINYWKAGVCLGLFVDAFKLGS
ncbi:Ycf20-like protein [Bienertia sinuspersici]